jgi:hypothetical protein
MAGGIAHLVYAPAELLDGKRVGNPARVVSDHTLDRGVGVAADKDGRMRLPYRLGSAVRRGEVDIFAVVFRRFGGPERLDGLDTFVQQRTASLRVGAVVA